MSGLRWTEIVEKLSATVCEAAARCMAKGELKAGNNKKKLIRTRCAMKQVVRVYQGMDAIVRVRVYKRMQNMKVIEVIENKKAAV